MSVMPVTSLKALEKCLDSPMPALTAMLQLVSSKYFSGPLGGLEGVAQTAVCVGGTPWHGSNCR